MGASAIADEAEPVDRPPRVFISHASEDKDGFVIPLARRLREQRVDAWLDVWEMHPGDSLVQKIYDEGIGTADVVVAVVSSSSVSKPWVQEEIAVASVRRVEGKVTMIPIILDGAPVPVALQHLLWIVVRSHDDAAVQDAAKKIVDRVYGLTARPPLGAAPRYASGLTIATGGGRLTHLDALMLQEATRRTLADEESLLEYVSIEFGDFVAQMRQLDIGEQDVADAITVLTERGYARAIHGIGRANPFSFQVTTLGVEQVIGGLVSDYEAALRRVGGAIVNQQLRRCSDIAAATATAEQVVAHIMWAWASWGWLKLSREVGAPPAWWSVSPSLRRWLQQEAGT